MTMYYALDPHPAAIVRNVTNTMGYPPPSIYLN